MTDERKGIEVFDGDGPSEVVLVERIVDMLRETYPKFKHSADRKYLEAKVRGLVESIEQEIAFIEKREAEEDETITGPEAADILDGLLDGNRNVRMKCLECKGTGGDTNNCTHCGGTGEIHGLQNLG